MDAQKVDMFMMNGAKYFEPHQVNDVREKLLALDDSKFPIIQTIDFKDPTTLLLISIFGGGLGIDRFILGDVGLGVGKLLTLGGCGIWALIDIFLIMGDTRRKNYEALMMAIS